MTLLNVAGLRVGFGGRHGEDVVRGVSFTVDAGECLAIVGESGSGKSVTARTLVGLAGDRAHVRAEALEFAGSDLRTLRAREWRALRGGRVGLVLQDALASLDPLRTVGDEVAEALRAHRVVERSVVASRVRDLLAEVGVPEPAVRAGQYPHQLSGGLRQRALIASAIAARPALVVADEPTTALDVTVQAQILDLLAARCAAGTALLLISHDLAVVARLADRIAVMKDGVFVEQGPAETVLTSPTHAYTRQLLAAIPAAATRGTRLAGGAPRVAPAQARPQGTVLEAAGLSKRYGDREVVADVSFTVAAGETLGLVGESGSGKTTTARLVLGLLAADAGEVRLEGQAWSILPEGERRPRRRRVGVVYQDPLSSFDPRYTVGRILAEALWAAGEPGRSRPARPASLLDDVGLSPTVLGRRPAQLSGGQRQRVAIARALASRPALLVCDEPVSALDVSIQAQVLDLLADLRAEYGLAMLFISHDLGVVHHVSDRVAVMRGGRIVETGPVDDVFHHPSHPYTEELLAAVPRPVRRPAPMEDEHGLSRQ